MPSKRDTDVLERLVTPSRIGRWISSSAASTRVAGGEYLAVLDELR